MGFGGLEVTWLGHAAVRIRTDDGTTILIDPFLDANPSTPDDEKHQTGVDAIYITHGHFDHLGDVTSLAAANGASVFAIHELATYLEGAGVENVTGSNKGGEVPGPNGVSGVMVNAVHSAGISGADGIVAGGEAAGWVLRFDGGPTVYHAGDTDVFGDMALIGEMWQPDIAFLPIGGWFTMGPDGAARAAKLLGVEMVVPIHFGTFPILSGTPDQLTEAAAGAFEIRALEVGTPSA